MIETPPEFFTPFLDDTGKGCVGVHTGGPAVKMLPGVWGEDLKGPGWLLRRLIFNALHFDRLLEKDEIGFTGTFSDGALLAVVSDPLRAVEIVVAELRAAMAGDFCQVGYLTRTGPTLSWHCVHPGPATKLNWLLDTDRMKLVDAAFIENMIRLRAAVKKLPPPPPASK